MFFAMSKVLYALHIHTTFNSIEGEKGAYMSTPLVQVRTVVVSGIKP